MVDSSTWTGQNTENGFWIVRVWRTIKQVYGRQNQQSFWSWPLWRSCWAVSDCYCWDTNDCTCGG